MSMQEYNFAVRMRSVIERIATRVVNRERPADQIGRVVDLDRGTQTAWVVYAGDEDTSLRVRMYPGRQPQDSDRIRGAGLGAIVRVSGPVGSRYITEVLSDAGHYDSPRFYQPTISSAGVMEDTLQAWYALSTSAVPARDGATRYYTGVLNLPSAAAMIDVYTEMILPDDTSYQQYEQIKFDNSATKGTDTAATLVSSTRTASSMALTTYYNLYDGTLDELSEGSLGLNLSHSLGASGTLTPVRANILLKVFSWNSQLLRIVDGISLGA